MTDEPLFDVEEREGPLADILGLLRQVSDFHKAGAHADADVLLASCIRLLHNKDRMFLQALDQLQEAEGAYAALLADIARLNSQLQDVALAIGSKSEGVRRLEELVDRHRPRQ